MSTYDLHSAAFFADPYDTYARMRQADPVYRDPATGIWFLTRYQDFCTPCTDPGFSNARVGQFFTGVSPELGEQVEVVRRFFAEVPAAAGNANPLLTLRNCRRVRPGPDPGG